MRDNHTGKNVLLIDITVVIIFFLFGYVAGRLVMENVADTWIDLYLSGFNFLQFCRITGYNRAKRDCGFNTLLLC